MREAKNIKLLSQLPIDFMGFIFYNKSKRFVGEDFDLSILSSISAQIKKTGVFVDSDYDYIASKIEKYQLAAVQLHGHELPTLCTDVRSFGVSVIKAFQLSENFDWNELSPYQDVCDYFLFDTASAGFGGSGQKFNWNKLQMYNHDIPFFLSGGIAPQDAQAIRSLQHPKLFAVDLNSCFEIYPGLKNIASLKGFINELKL